MATNTANPHGPGTLLIALGGHALMPLGATPSVEGQFAQAAVVMRSIAELIETGWRVVITHGNGPQVGNILTRSELAAAEAYVIPLSIAVAESEGEIGYIVQQVLYNELAARHLHRPIATVLTQVEVREDDRAFQHPTKPIGPVLTDAQANALRERGVSVQRFPAGLRRTVASPEPVRIVEAGVVRQLAESGVVVIAAGGGGIPVVSDGERLRGVDAVVDKDLASATLAIDIAADRFLIVTDVDAAYLDFGTPQQKAIARLTVAEARRLASEGHFPPGSMGPKIEGACRFAERTGRPAAITSSHLLKAAVAGEAGTAVVT